MTSIIATHVPLDRSDLLELTTQRMRDLIAYCTTHPNTTSEEADAYTDVANRLTAIVGTTRKDNKS